MSFTIRSADGSEELDVAEHMFREVYEPQGYTRVSASESLGKLTRDELNRHAENLGIADPAHYQNKDALLQAIEDHQAAEAQAVDEQIAAQDAQDAAGDEEPAEADTEDTGEDDAEADEVSASDVSESD